MAPGTVEVRSMCALRLPGAWCGPLWPSGSQRGPRPRGTGIACPERPPLRIFELCPSAAKRTVAPAGSGGSSGRGCHSLSAPPSSSSLIRGPRTRPRGCIALRAKTEYGGPAPRSTPLRAAGESASADIEGRSGLPASPRKHSFALKVDGGMLAVRAALTSGVRVARAHAGRA